MSLVPITAIIPSTGDRASLYKTLKVIKSCRPGVNEIVVHLDMPAAGAVERLEAEHPDVKIIFSMGRQGPGGSRNKLVAAASHELIANFDDDSFPDQENYFARIMQTAALFPDAAIISAASQSFEKEMPGYHVIAVASGCGCVFRKSWFQRTHGFVPLEVAYGMEEVDISLQLHSIGGWIVHDPGLHVKHEGQPPIKVSADLNAKVIANFALLPYLRYPRSFWPVGLWQLARRCIYGITRGWMDGTWRGLEMIPRHLRVHKRYVARVGARALCSWLILRMRARKVASFNNGASRLDNA